LITPTKPCAIFLPQCVNALYGNYISLSIDIDAEVNRYRFIEDGTQIWFIKWKITRTKHLNQLTMTSDNTLIHLIVNRIIFSGGFTLIVVIIRVTSCHWYLLTRKPVIVKCNIDIPNYTDIMIVHTYHYNYMNLSLRNARHHRNAVDRLPINYFRHLK